MSSAGPSFLIARTLPQRLGVFVDVQNMFYSAKLLHQSKIDYGRLLKEIVGSRQLVRALAYIVRKADVDQSSFHEALRRHGYELKIKELKVRADADGQTSVAKASWQVAIAVDAIMLAPKLDTVALVTGDGDHVPLVECLKLHGCRVEVFSFDRSTSGELIKAADEYVPIQPEWMFKEEKFLNAQPQGLHSGLGSTARGTIYEGLPRDEDLDAESRAAEQNPHYGQA